MTISTTLWFVYRGMIYCGVSGLLLSFIPPLRMQKVRLWGYWLLNLLVIGIWYISQFSATNWLVTSTPLRWIVALWLNANMAYVAMAAGFLVLRLSLALLRQTPRRQFWRQPNVMLLPIACMLSGFGVYEAMQPPVYRHYDLYLEQLPPALDGMKIAQLTDSHIGDFVGVAELTSAINRLNAEKPDLFAFTGDLLDDDRQLDATFAALATVNAPLGTIAILGNHEKYQGLDAILKKYQAAAGTGRIRLLVDDSLMLNYHGTDFQVIGVDYPLQPNSRRKLAESAEKAYMQRSADKAFSKLAPETWHLLLTHHPDFFDLAVSRHISLALAGHTHGGQALPLSYTVGRLWSEYVKGWFQQQQSGLYVSTGMGHVWPYRLGVPTEIVTFTLHQKK